MTTETYTFSYMAPSTIHYLERRPWWAFWRHDTLKERSTWRRVWHSNLSAAEAAFIKEALGRGFATPEAKVFSRILGPITHPQLEIDVPCSSPILTTGSKPNV